MGDTTDREEEGKEEKRDNVKVRLVNDGQKEGREKISKESDRIR